MKKILGFSFITAMATLAAGCQPCPKCASCPAAGNASAVADKGTANNMSATVDGVVINLDNIGDYAKEHIAAEEKAHREKLYQIQTAALQDAVENKLIENEAKRRGVTLEQLQMTEFVEKITTPSDEEMRKIYEESGAQAEGMEFDQVKSQIRVYLIQGQQEELHNKLISELKAKAKITYDIPLLPIDKQDLKLGDISAWGDASKAKVVVVEFSDFECPYCSRGAKVVDEALKGYGPEVIRVFKHFPLPFHQHAAEAAKAAVCAQKQGKFWEVHDQLFAHQKELSSENIRNLAKEGGVNEAQFNDCMSDEAAANLVAADFAKGEEIGIEGTPTVFVNGMQMNIQSADEMRLYIDAELKAAR